MIWLESEFDKNESLVGFPSDVVTSLVETGRMESHLLIKENYLFDEICILGEKLTSLFKWMRALTWKCLSY